jgi:hypothetical protein
MRKIVHSFILVVGLLGANLIAQVPERRLAIGTVLVTANQIADARAVPGLDGAVSILITVDPGVANAIAKAAARSAGKPIPVSLNGKPLGEVAALPPATEPIEVPVKLALSEAEGVAIHISGKPPLPDSLEEGE